MKAFSHENTVIAAIAKPISIADSFVESCQRNLIVVHELENF